MTFQSSAEMSASERFMLVRITPRKFLGVGTSIGGGQYTFNIGTGFNVASVIVNKLDEPTWVYSSGVLTVTSANDLTLPANIVTIDHNIYLTGTKTRYTSGVSGVPDAEWSPLISSYPRFSQSMRNITEGVFSLSGSELSLISTDRWVNKLLGDNDSLSSAPVTVWACIDSVSTNRRIFDGEVSSVSLAYGEVSLSLIDNFVKLSQIASFGTRSQSHVYTGNGGQYPDPNEENRPIPLTMGRSSPFKIANGYRHGDAFGNTPGKLYHLNYGQNAIRITPEGANQASSTTWIAGRFVGADVKRLNFGTFSGNTLVVELSRAFTTNVNVTAPFSTVGSPEVRTAYMKAFVLYCQVSQFNGEIGDYIPAAYTAGYGDGFVCGYGSGLNGSYNLAIYCQNFKTQYVGQAQDVFAPVNYGNTTISALSIPNNTLPSMSVWVEGADQISYNLDAYELNGIVATMTYNVRFSQFSKYIPFTFSVSDSYSLGGETISTLKFTVAPDTTANISASRLMVRFSPADEMSHGDCLKFIVKSSGMVTNDATFTSADSDLSANVSLTAPIGDVRAFDKYISVAQRVTSSTLSILRVNENREVEYEIIKSPGSLSTDSVRSSINMLQGDTSTALEYQDIVTRVDFENPQLYGLSEVGGGGAIASVSDLISEQLHRVTRGKTHEHCLTNIQSRKTAIAGYLSSATVQYTLATSSEDLATSIGDVIEMTNNAAASDGTTVKGIVVSLDQSGGKSLVKINEIRGV